ncbi:cation:proton antiporter [Humidisolicoccus flavus]|uniref:cation:proton antiporter n=1 Tax=Humidisolicoccus flavus TaxID=3111414 RepID=UPI0032528F25
MHEIATETTLIVVIGIITVGLVAMFAKRIGIAAPLLLVVVGAGLSLVPAIPSVVISPDIILTVILPPLLYTAALSVPAVEFRRNLRVILLLSVVLVVVSAFAVAAVVNLIWPAVGFAICLALGAVVAPPDAVAATSIAKRLGLPPRLVTILEGEGLVNDATALVLLSTAIAAATASGEASGGEALGAFAYSVAVAALIGYVVARLILIVRSRIADGTLDIAVSLTAPFLAFLPAEEANASGVIAVVVAGIFVGNRGQSRILAARRLAERNTWQAFTFIVENGVFLLMGMQLPVVVMAVSSSDPGALATIGVALLICVLLVAVRYAMLPILFFVLRRSLQKLERQTDRAEKFSPIVEQRLAEDERLRSRVGSFRRRLELSQNDLTALRDQKLGMRDGIALGWAGMRGVVTVAAVQTLPRDHDMYPQLVLVGFAIAVVTLLVQGGTLPLLIKLLGIQRDSRAEEANEVAVLMRQNSDIGRKTIADLGAAQGVDEALIARAQQGEATSANWMELVASSDPEDENSDAAVIRRLRIAAVDAKRAELAHHRGLGGFSSEAIAAAQHALDSEEIAIRAEFNED